MIRLQVVPLLQAEPLVDQPGRLGEDVSPLALGGVRILVILGEDGDELPHWVKLTRGK